MYVRLKSLFQPPGSTISDFSISSIGSTAISVSLPGADDFPFPTKTRHVKKARHNETPELPPPNAAVKEVRYFLFVLLTNRKYSCAREYPEWILETCMGFKGNGHDLRSIGDQQLKMLCPIIAVQTGIRSRTHKPGNYVPAKARADIGRIIANYVADHLARERQPQDVHRGVREERQRHAEALTVAPHTGYARSMLEFPSSTAGSVSSLNVHHITPGFMSPASISGAGPTYSIGSHGLYSHGPLAAEPCAPSRLRSVHRNFKPAKDSVSSSSGSVLRGSSSTTFTGNIAKTSPPQSMKQQDRGMVTHTPRHRQSVPNFIGSTSEPTADRQPTPVSRAQSGSQSNAHDKYYNGISSNGPQHYAPPRPSALQEYTATLRGIPSASLQNNSNARIGASIVNPYASFGAPSRVQNPTVPWIPGHTNLRSRASFRSKASVPSSIAEESEALDGEEEHMKGDRHDSADSYVPRPKLLASRSSPMLRNSARLFSPSPIPAEPDRVRNSNLTARTSSADFSAIQSSNVPVPRATTTKEQLTTILVSQSRDQVAADRELGIGQYSPETLASIETEHERLNKLRTSESPAITSIRTELSRLPSPELPKKSCRRPASPIDAVFQDRPSSPRMRAGARSPTQVRFQEPLEKDMSVEREEFQAARRLRHEETGQGSSADLPTVESVMQMVRDV